SAPISRSEMTPFRLFDFSTFRLFSLLAFALALLSKPTSTPLPLFLLLLDWWPLNRLTRRALCEQWPYFLLAAASAAISALSHALTIHTAPPDASLAQVIPMICYKITFLPGAIFCAIHRPIFP